jgi:O-antigen/teichoic acid export membrane protein
MSVLRLIKTRISTLRRSAKGGFLRKGFWGIADQGLISLTNFATMVLLARGLGPAAFGTFTLVYGAMLFANSLQGALIIQPHCVLSASRKGGEYSQYTLSTAVTQVMFSGVVAVLTLISGGVSWAQGWNVTGLLLALAPCVVAWQSQEFLRRVLYNEGRFSAAFYNNLVTYGGQTLAIAALWWWGHLTGVAALHAITIASFAGTVLGAWKLRSSLRGTFQLSVIRENWQFGKWLAGAEMGYWLSSQVYLYLAAVMLGTAATGNLKAAYVIFGPMRIFGFFLKSVLPNQFARTLVSGGNAALTKQVSLVYWTVAPCMGSFCLLVAACAGPIMSTMYGSKYVDGRSVLVLYAAFAFIAFMAQIVGCALRAKRLTKRVFASQAYASLVAVPVGWLIIQMLGIHGAVVGMILTSLVVNYSNWRAYRRAVSDDVPQTEEQTGALQAQLN